MSEKQMYSLFTDRSIEALGKNMTPEQKKQYEQMGNHMYGAMDYETASSIIDQPATMEEAAKYLIETVKSGMHPSFLNENEQKILEETLGKEWYKKYGYVEGDLKEMVTLGRT